MTDRIGYLSGAPRVSTHPRSDVTGPRSHVVGLIEGFRRIGCDVRPFIVGDHAPTTVATRGHRIITRNAATALMADVGRLGLRPFTARAAWQALGPDIDWVYERFAAFQGLGRQFQRRGIPWLLETQGPFYEEASIDRRSLMLVSLARRLELRAYRQCDRLICVSHELARRLTSAAGLPEGKVCVVPNGVDPDRFDPAARGRTRFFDDLTLVYAGSLTPWQGIDMLLHALAEVRRRGVRICVVVVGDGIMRPAWEQLAGALGLEECVRFLGRLPADDVPPVIRACDLGFAGHSPQRGSPVYHSPLKLYEYLAMAKPVIASATDDAAAVVHEGDSGFLYTPGNVPELVQALQRAWDARERGAAMGAAARAHVLERHTWVHRAAAIQEAAAAVRVGSAA